MMYSWDSLNALAEEHGDSYYLINFLQFQENYQAFLTAFTSVYSKSQIAYSYKTNYTPRLCQLVNAWGGYAEVVSGMEYSLAVRMGVPADRIIFNGPYKQRQDLTTALINGSIVNLDSDYEINLIKILAAQFPDHIFRLGIRCNFDIGTEQRSRFGFDVTRSSFQAQMDTLRELPNCHIIGLHCHFLAPQRSANAYGKIAKNMLDLAMTTFKDDALEFIDLGGGFFSRMNAALQSQFAHPIPTFTEYGHAIATEFKHAFPLGSGPELILEPGIALTADTMKFVAKTIDLKKVGHRKIALVAGSIYDIKPTLNKRNLPLTVFSKTIEQGQSQPIDITGYTCMEDDCLYRGYMGPLKRDDFVVFDNVGSYTNVLRPPFINPAPPILSWTSDGDIEIIRRRETGADIFCTYSFG